MEPDTFESLAKDPTFVKAAKTLVNVRNKYDGQVPMKTPGNGFAFSEEDVVKKASGGAYSRGDVDAWLKEAAKPSMYNVLQKVGQGVTFNFLDELRGAAKGKTAEDAMRLQEDAYTGENPGGATAGEVGGSVINPVNLALTAATAGGSEAVPALLQRLGLGGLSKLPALVKAGLIGGGTGAAEGAAYGAGEGKTPDERTALAAQGAEGGGAAGLLLPAAGVANKLLKGTFASAEDRAAATVARGARAAGGRDAIVGAASDMTDAGIDPTLADMPGMGGAGGVHATAASLDPATQDATQGIVDARRAAAPDLMKGALNDALPPDVGTDFGQASDIMDKARRAEFDPRYAALDAAHPQVGGSPEAVLGGAPKVRDIAADPSHPLQAKAVNMITEASTAEREAIANSEMPGVPRTPPDPVYAPLAKLIKRDPEVQTAWNSAMREAKVGETPDMGRPSIATLRNMRGKLQDRVENLFREGSANTALKLKTSIETLNGVLDHETSIPDPVTGEVNPLKSLDAEYRQAMDAKRALNDGRVWYNAQESNGIPHSITGLKAKLSAMSPAELDAFRTGTASSIVHDLEHAQVNRNVAQELLNSSDYRKQMLRSVFDNGAQMEQFMGKVKQMAQAAKLSATIGGSPTASRLAGAANGEPALDAGDITKPVSLLKKMGQTAVAGIGPTSRQAYGSALGNLTLTRGTPQIDDLLKKLLSPESGVPAFLQNPSAAGAAGAAGAATAGSQ